MRQHKKAAPSAEHVWIDGPGPQAPVQPLPDGRHGPPGDGANRMWGPVPGRATSPTQARSQAPEPPVQRASAPAEEGAAGPHRRPAESSRGPQDGPYFTSEQGKADAATRPSYPSTSERPATAKQIAYIKALLAKEGTNNMSVKGIPQDLTTLTSREASALIDDIKGN